MRSATAFLLGLALTLSLATAQTRTGRDPGRILNAVKDAGPGDKIAVSGLERRIVEAAGQSLTTSLPRDGKTNPACASFKPAEPDATENAQSVGSHITFGKFRAPDLGDLTVQKEFELMCPNNRLGTVLKGVNRST